jgi:hypothetical protein
MKPEHDEDASSSEGGDARKSSLILNTYAVNTWAAIIKREQLHHKLEQAHGNPLGKLICNAKSLYEFMHCLNAANLPYPQ